MSEPRTFQGPFRINIRHERVHLLASDLLVNPALLPPEDFVFGQFSSSVELRIGKSS